MGSEGMDGLTLGLDQGFAMEEIDLPFRRRKTSRWIDGAEGLLTVNGVFLSVLV